MARTAPQAKNSTISAVSTTLARKRFIIEPPRNWRCDWHLQPIWQPAAGPAHLQVLMSNSTAPKANARRATPVGSAQITVFMGLWTLSGGTLLEDQPQNINDKKEYDGQLEDQHVAVVLV